MAAAHRGAATDTVRRWAVACEQAFGPGQHPVAIAHEWNTIAHLNDYEGNKSAVRSSSHPL